MLINASEGEECRIAVVEDGKLEELYMERTSSTSHVGNIYKGRVTNVEPSIQAAFVDFGLGRNGFLHISDLMPQYFGKKHEDVTEAVGKKIARKDRPPIQRCLKRGDEIIVQIIKEGIGTKGPTLSTYVSIPGRILVMMPGMSKFGISRKIEDEDERRRLRGILDGLKCPDDVGFIVRTAGVGKAKAEISRDLQYLTRLWKNIQDKLKKPAPVELYTEGDLVTRTVRDVFSSDVERIVVDNKEVARRVKEFFKIAMPRTKNRVDLYEDPIPLFHRYNIENEIEQMYSRHVPLPSGGSLVIDQTEAVVAIDVNSGKFRDHSDAETTAFKTDMEAADEIPRQLKLRDLGGVIICDFIDLRFERHRRELEKKLHDNLKKDRAKTKVLRMSQFGIIEMTRQRMRPSLKKSIYCDCPHCKGSGLVKTPESMSLDMMRRLTIAAASDKVVRVELSVNPEVALYILNKKRQHLTAMEVERQKRIIVRHDSSLALDEFRLALYDARDGMVYLSELGMTPLAGRPGVASAGAGGHGGASAGRGAPPQQQQQRRSQQQARLQREQQGSAIDELRSELVVTDASAPPEVPGAPAGKVEPVEHDDADANDPESQVVDVEDGHEAMGDAPRAFDDDRGDRFGRRNGGGRRDRHGHRDRGGQQPRHDQPRHDQPRPDQPRPHDPRAAQNPADPNAAPGETGGRRRRRRRGRRGRGRGGQQSPQPLGGATPGQGSPGVSAADLYGGPEPHPDDAAELALESRDAAASASPHRPDRAPRHQPAGGRQPVEPRPEPGNRRAPDPDDVADAPYDDPEDPTPAPGNEKDAPPPAPRTGGKGGKGGRARGGGRDDRRGGQRGNAQRGKGPQPGRNRGGGGGRPQRSQGRNAGGNRGQNKVVYEGLPVVDDEEPAPISVPAPRPTPPQARATPVPPPIPVVRTGSADKHLADDIPADYTPPAPRPRTYRDLDELPEFDE